MIALSAASILLFSGHALRMFRTRFILRNYLNKEDKAYWLSLGFGYLFDFFSPIRLSDIIRSYSFARISKSPWALGLGLIIIERLADLLLVCLVFLCFGMDARFLLIVGIILSLFALSASLSPVKKFYYGAASLFNDSLKNFFLGVYWAFLRLRKDTIETPKTFAFFTALSLLMWVCYMGSVYVLALAFRASSVAELLMLQFSGLRTAGFWNRSVLLSSEQLPFYYLYLFVPIALAFLAAFLPASKKENKTMKIIPFLDASGSLEFFDRFFLGSHSPADETYYRMTHDSFCIKDLSAASEAKTFLMQGEKGLFIRKIALAAAAEKLKAQYEWIISHPKLPLPKIYKTHEEPGLFSYDMEYFANGESLFTAIHRFPLEKSWEIILNILSIVKKTYQPLNISDSTASARQYLDERIHKNIKICLDGSLEINNLSQKPHLYINGSLYPNPLHHEKKLFDYAEASLYHLPKYEIHGDLTVDNILVGTNGGYLMIDPAPAVIDLYSEYAKLFQSFHAKYEYVKNGRFEINNDSLNYPRYDSIQYEHLYQKLCQHFSDEGGALKSIYFYETVCHIRTMSYMVRLGKPQAVLMLALACQAYAEWEKL